MLHLNVRSLNQNFESIKEILTIIKFEFELICLTEAGCADDPGNETLFYLNNYMAVGVVYASLLLILQCLN